MANSDLKIRTRDYALSLFNFRGIAEKDRNSNSRAPVVAVWYFISKIEGSLQELEESEYWLELLGDSELVSQERLAGVKNETEN